VDLLFLTARAEDGVTYPLEEELNLGQFHQPVCLIRTRILARGLEQQVSGFDFKAILLSVERGSKLSRDVVGKERKQKTHKKNRNARESK